jgi:hypothetical protein
MCALLLAPLSLSAQDRRGGGMRGGMGEDRSPEVGAAAPDFELDRLAEKGKVKLSSFKGKKPVVLIFGSYT